jgi:hypothetical protein
MFTGGDFNVFFRYQDTFCLMGDGTTMYGHDLLLDTRSKNIYGLGVGISTVFKIFGHILYQGGQDHFFMVMTLPYNAT